MNNNRNLKNISSIYKTDKLEHGYIEIYESYFDKIKDQKLITNITYYRFSFISYIFFINNLRNIQNIKRKKKGKTWIRNKSKIHSLFFNNYITTFNFNSYFFTNFIQCWSSTIF